MGLRNVVEVEVSELECNVSRYMWTEAASELL